MRKVLAAFLVMLAAKIDARTVAQFAVMAVKHTTDGLDLILVKKAEERNKD
ncbi:MAG: hypothetical protein WC455_14365 [Dehalococcoidia bacterium]|jgi:hypothetical protein